MNRFAINQRASIKVEARNLAGNLANADVAPSIAITDSAGVAVPGSPFTPTHPPAVMGVYEVILLPTALDTYDVTMIASVDGITGQKFLSEFEVVGGFLFDIEDLRTLYPDFTAGDYSFDTVRSAREAAEESFESATGVAWVPRARRVTLDGDGTPSIIVPNLEPRRVMSGSIDDVALVAADITDLAYYSHGEVVRKTTGSWAAGDKNVSLLYEHGFDAPPGRVSRAVMRIAVAVLDADLVSDRASSYTANEGDFRLAVPNRDGHFGIPNVDAVVDDVSRRAPVAL